MINSNRHHISYRFVVIAAYCSNSGHCVFEPAFPIPLGDLGTTYDDHLGLIEKRVVDFLTVLNELFSLGVMTEALRVNIGSKSAISLHRGLVDPKFQVEGVAPTNHSSSQKTRLNDLSYGIKIWADLSSLFSERELMFMFAICRRPSVCLSSVVCNVRAPYSGAWAEFEFSAWGASWRAWHIARASGSLRAEPSVGSRGKAPGQGVWWTQSPRS